MAAQGSDAGSDVLCADGRRSRRALLHAIVAPLVALAVMLVVWQPRGHWAAASVLLALVAFNLYALAYVRLTWRVFARVDAAEFARRMEVRRLRRRAGMRRLLPGGDGPSFAISSSLVAFVVVLVIPHIDAIRVEDWLLVVISLTILLACWGLSVSSYALHYAQYDLAEPGLQFAGTRTGAFEDYVYFAIGVATTLGATDVSIITPQMRRTANFNVIIAFLFNSVVVALLVSILVR